MRFLQGTYMQRAEEAPDVCFAFNPGFTCPDYDWSETVKTLTRSKRSPGSGSSSGARRSGVPVQPCMLVATNTSMEAQMEAEWLQEYGWHSEDSALPNPYTSLKLLQSGTLANDLYRKNAWLVVYEHRPTQPRLVRGGRSGKRSAKAAAKRAAKALYSAMVAPVARLLRKR
ncbi:hypothetical protein VOLCADRAFT_103109 [Volvox carteri f. nagariensis]|uniref:Uncharacterized protein n=1 Tax=Volvox carteri f. nagariensis TaxID=3068 RepID=D8TKN9_VOLCA|nr:uncharacterized protein VOLCADRAFT_103109 [Volvox carteri f. nagariensis]EFJ52095.1 hypothetical protein VOLCADRAFT_103109 [Volvox carteri f. nagariensis]|eukprot:XP_002946869.1 hypothetical protein VOLCADRAFT_103109 [Volvox carteri f. nagariensis]